MCLTILFCAGMPILLPILIVFCVTSVVMDRMNLLTRYEPPPLTNALTLRFVISVFLPPFLMLHCVLGSIMFGLAAGEEMRHAAPHAESVNVLLHPPLQLYLAFSVVFVAFEAFHFCVVARRSNLRLSVRLRKHEEDGRGVAALTRRDMWCERDVLHARKAEVLLWGRRSVVAVQEDVLEAVNARTTHCAALQRRHQRLLLYNHAPVSHGVCLAASKTEGG